MSPHLGEEPFSIAYDFVYGLAESVYKEFGAVRAHMSGLMFENGKIISITRLDLPGPEFVVPARAHMLSKFHMVAHVSEAWVVAAKNDDEMKVIEDQDIMPSEHPNREEVIMIMLHTTDLLFSAKCPVDPVKKTIERGELIMPEIVGGRMHPDPTKRRHMAS